MGFSAALHLPQWDQVSAVYTDGIWERLRLSLSLKPLSTLKLPVIKRRCGKKAAKENRTFIIRRKKDGFYEVRMTECTNQKEEGRHITQEKKDYFDKIKAGVLPVREIKNGKKFSEHYEKSLG